MATKTSARWRSAHARAAEGELNLDLVKAELYRVRNGVVELKQNLDIISRLKLDAKLVVLDHLITLAKLCFRSPKPKGTALGKSRVTSRARRSSR